jgi:zinc protease
MTTPATTSPVPATPRPEPGTPRPYHFPRFERRTLPNGLRLVVAPVHKLPVVTVAAVVKAGATCDPDGRDGLAALTARALTEGTTSLDAVAFTRTVERLGAAVDAGADWDAALVSLTALADKLPEAFRLFADVLVRPAFPEREVERLKAERVAEILQLRTEPRGLADEMFARFVYAAGSRYGRPEAGDERTVQAISRDDVARFHAERFVPGATTLVVAGDVTADEAERLALGALGDWAGEAPSASSVNDAPAARARRVHLVAKADAPQSELRVGHVGVPRTTPDYFAIVVMNAILGGLFNSRVNMNLREEHAYTYGAGSGFDWRLGAGPFDVSSAVQSAVTVPALTEILKEIDRMRETPVLDSELSLATSYLDGVFPIRYETTAAIATALANLTIYGLPEDYFDTYRERIRSVTAEQVQAAAQQYLKPDELQLVVVGDPGAVREGLEALGAGPVTVYDAEGKPSAV